MLRFRWPARLVGVGTAALGVAAAIAPLSIRLAALPIGIAAGFFFAAAVEWLVPSRLKILAHVIYGPLVTCYVFGVVLMALDQHDPARLLRAEAHYRLSDRIEYGIDFKNAGGLHACNLRMNIGYLANGSLHSMPNRGDVGGCIQKEETIGPHGFINQPPDRFTILRVTVCYASRGRISDREKRDDFYYYYRPDLPVSRTLPHASSEHITLFLSTHDPNGVVHSLDSCR